jgi:hypothetical protein
MRHEAKARQESPFALSGASSRDRAGRLLPEADARAVSDAETLTDATRPIAAKWEYACDHIPRKRISWPSPANKKLAL